MPELLLDQRHRLALHHQLVGMRMPQAVRVNALGDPGLARIALERLAYRRAAHWPTDPAAVIASRAEQRRGRIDAELRAHSKPPLHVRRRSRIDRHDVAQDETAGSL